MPRKISTDTERILPRKILGSLNTFMEGYRLLRACILNCALDCNELRHPPRLNEVLIDECDAVLQKEVIDSLLVDERDDDFIWTDDTQFYSGRK